MDSAKPLCVEVLEERGQAVVHLALCPVVASPAPAAAPARRCGAPTSGVAHGEGAERMDGPLLFRGGAPDERPDRLGRIEVVVADRVPARRMRTDEGGVDEERRITVLLQPLDHRLAHEARLGELDGKARRGPGRTVGVGSRETLYRLVQLVRVGRDVEPLRREPAPPGGAPLLPRVLDEGAESGQHPLVAEQPRIAGRHGARIDRGVRVPEEHRVVARLTGQQRHVGEAGVQRRPVEDGAVAVLVGARVEAGPRRSARRRVGPVVGEQDAPARQGVEGRRLDDRMAEGRQAVPAPLVERDEEDVAGRRHAATLADVDAPRARPAGRMARRPATAGLRTCGSSLLRASSRTRSATPRGVAPRPGALLGHRSPGGRWPSAAPRRPHSSPPRRARSPRTCRSHQIPPVGVGLGLHCLRLDHPFTSLASLSFRITTPAQRLTIYTES